VISTISWLSLWGISWQGPHVLPCSPPLRLRALSPITWQGVR